MARTPYFFQLRKDLNEQWRWSFYGPDHHHLAVSGESYESEAACLVAINNLIRMSGNAVIHSAQKGPHGATV